MERQNFKSNFVPPREKLYSGRLFSSEFNHWIYVKYCQTPTPGETWELTLLSQGNIIGGEVIKKLKSYPP
jgi:hypothetical protein